MVYGTTGKRLIDLIVAAPLLLLALPAMTIVALLVKLKLGSPVIFSQERMFCNGETFKILKFRSMLNTKDSDGNLLPDEQRLTKFGKFLRASSLDELPSLLNIIKGDMSLIGPRPLSAVYLERFNETQAKRQQVKPGLTGWAQINGRNCVEWDTKFEMDVWYVENISLWLDLKILMKTPWVVLIAEGVNSPDHATMPEFLGTEKSIESNTEVNGNHIEIQSAHVVEVGPNGSKNKLKQSHSSS